MPSECLGQSLTAWISHRVQAVLDWIEAPGRSPLASARRLLLTLGLVFVLGMLPWHIDSGRARWWAPVCLGVLVGILLAGLGLGSRLGPRVLQAMQTDGQISFWRGRFSLRAPDLGLQRSIELVWQVLRRMGVLLPALGFFVFWALIYIAIWSWDPAACSPDPALACKGSFGGLGTQPVFGDFLYYAINMAFANPVPDVLGRSRLVHALNMVEVMSGIGLASLYAGAFFGVQGNKDLAS